MAMECGRSLAFFFCVSEIVYIICFISGVWGGRHIQNAEWDKEFAAKEKLDMDSIWQKVIAICIVSSLWFASINSWQGNRLPASSKSHQNDKNAGLCNSGLTGRSITLTQAPTGAPTQSFFPLQRAAAKMLWKHKDVTGKADSTFSWTPIVKYRTQHEPLREPMCN